MDITQIVKSSFYVTYVFLITTGTITFIESLRTQNPVIRHIMNLETCISIIAAYFYSIFISKIYDNKDSNIPYDEVTTLRYTDWMISTPFMLFVLCMVLANEKKIPFTIKTYSIILLLDIAMLVSGYLGETHVIDKYTGLFIGFVFLYIMFAYIWYIYMHNGKNNFIVLFTFLSFLSLWSIYGIAYMTDEKIKNIMYNILDLISKAFMGIFFWMFFTKSITF